MQPVLVGADAAAILVQLEQVDGPLFVHDTADGNLVIALLLVLGADGHIGQRGNGGEHGIGRVLAVLEAHIPDSGGILVDLLGQFRIHLAGLLELAGLDSLVVLLDKSLGLGTQRRQFGCVLFSGHFQMPLSQNLSDDRFITQVNRRRTFPHKGCPRRLYQ